MLRSGKFQILFWRLDGWGISCEIVLIWILSPILVKHFEIFSTDKAYCHSDISPWLFGNSENSILQIFFCIVIDISYITSAGHHQCPHARSFLQIFFKLGEDLPCLKTSDKFDCGGCISLDMCPLMTLMTILTFLSQILSPKSFWNFSTGEADCYAKQHQVLGFQKSLQLRFCQFFPYHEYDWGLLWYRSVLGSVIFRWPFYLLFTLTLVFQTQTWPMMTSSNRKHFPRYWPFVRGIHRSLVNSPLKGQWRRALMFSLLCAWINGWVNNREAGDLRCYCAHYDVIVMQFGPSSFGVYIPMYWPLWILLLTVLNGKLLNGIFLQPSLLGSIINSLRPSDTYMRQ